MVKKLKKQFVHNSNIQVKQEPNQYQKHHTNDLILKVQQPQIKQEEIPLHQQVVHQQSPQQLSQRIRKKKHNRIIIRNLIVDINEKLLRKLCSKYGEVEQINIPKHPLKNCSKGYAFVEFKSKNMCLKAIKELNQSVYKGRTIVVDMAVGKDLYTKMNVKEQEDVIEPSQKPQEQPTTIPQSVTKKASIPTPPLINKTIVEEELQKQQQPNKRIEKFEEDLQNTIFIRNVPLTATEKDLFNLFRKYGKIKFAKLVIDKQTEEPRGTAFIKFKEPNVAQPLIDYSREYEQSLSKKDTKFIEDPTINLELQGRILKIFPTESKTNLSSKLETRATFDSKKVKPIGKISSLEELVLQDHSNKRNLSLALEGIYKAEQWMGKQDAQKFENHEKEKLQKLKNPNNSVSTTRVIFKYLPRRITQQEIFTICRTFLEEKFPGKSHSAITFCKLMLDSKREKSIGIAFVEFNKSEISLAFVRWVTQNSRVLFNKQVVLCQFAIQSAKKLNLLSKKIKKVIKTADSTQAGVKSLKNEKKSWKKTAKK